MRAFVTKNPVLSFVLLTLGYQWLVIGIVDWHLKKAGLSLEQDETAHMIFRMRVFGPLVFCVFLTWYIEGTAGLKTLFGSFFNWRVPGKWYLFGATWKFLFSWIGVGFLVLFGMRDWPGFFNPQIFNNSELAMGLLKTMPFLVGIAIVEETAWMKYCVTRMQDRYSALTSCLIIGVAWGCWYLPMIITGEGVPDGYPPPIFMLSMLCLTILLGWAYNMTHSGTILLLMQVVSNGAFFLLPVLPGWHVLPSGELDTAYVNAFVAINSLSAILIVVIFGWREMGTRKRATWSEAHAATLAKEKNEESGSAQQRAVA
ncbi:MAG: CPBP family intramembrane metalloprotease [Flavobacteriales bacterium]|nr:CPBP family intramembrane metalloprotease [Flavobacteriales bacterium]